MKPFPHLLSPLTLGRCQVRNRILVSAHVPGFAENNKPGEQYLAYHRQYAKSGVGLQITGATPVHKSGMLSTGSDGLWNLDDSIIPGYRALSDAVHNEGGHILAQLAHSAGTVLINQPGNTSWSASEIRSEITGTISHAMNQLEIDEVMTAHAIAAKRAITGGMDGIEVLGAFGFLPQAFLSPLTNFRNDHYGGDLHRRLRFTIELLSAIRESIGPKPILGIRIPGDEFEPGGLTLVDMKIVSRELAGTQHLDYINVIAHTNITHTGRSRHWPPTPAPHGLFIPLAAAIREVVDIPVFGVGRVTSPEFAEKIIADKQADMVGMTRANICDPDLVGKIMRGEPEQIRPCVGANTCIANRYAGKPINCAHNAAVSTPGRVLAKATEAKRVAVIGAGPAGLEAARVAATCGHRVEIYESQSQAGGQLRLWAATTSMRELIKIIRWRLSELARLGVEVQFNQHIDTNFAHTEFDAVIVATGAKDYTRKINGNTQIEVLSPHALLRNQSTSAKRALILNEGRGQAGLAAAEFLLEHNVEVEIVTTDVAVANDLDATNRNSWYTRLGKMSCNFSAALEIIRVENKKVELRNIFDQRIYSRENIDLIVDWRGCQSNDDLRQITTTARLEFIGDCNAPRTLEIAIAEALNAASNTLSIS